MHRKIEGVVADMVTPLKKEHDDKYRRNKKIDRFPSG